MQSFCSKYGPAPVINVVEDLFSQHFFFEGSVLTASAWDSRIVECCWPVSAAISF